MSLKEIIAKINVNYSLKLTDEEKSSLIYSCRLAGFRDSSKASDVTTLAMAQLEKMRKKPENPLTKKAKSSLVVEDCPVCGGSMKPIKLACGRSATYCATHKVVMPTKED